MPAGEISPGPEDFEDIRPKEREKNAMDATIGIVPKTLIPDPSIIPVGHSRSILSLLLVRTRRGANGLRSHAE
jgi:hypothetical protein